MKKTIARLTAAVAACTAVLAASLPVSAASDIAISSNFAGASGDVANGSMLTTFPELESVNKNARIKNSFGKRCIGMGAGENSAAELVYKLTVPEGEQLTELTITVNALLAARPDKDPTWTGDEYTPYAMVSVSEDGLAYTDVKTWKGTRLSETGLGNNDYGSNDAVKALTQDYTADLKEAAAGMQTIYVKLHWVSWDDPQWASVFKVDIAGKTAAEGETGGEDDNTPGGDGNTPGGEDGNPDDEDKPITQTGVGAPAAACVLLAAAAAAVLFTRKRS